MENKLKIAYLGSRPLSIKILSLIQKTLRKFPKKVELYILTSSDDYPPEGVVKWWQLGNLRKEAKKTSVNFLKSKDDLLKQDFDLVIMVFYNNVIPRAIIRKVRGGIVNIHFGYLPSVGYSQKNGSSHKVGYPFSKGTYRGCNVLSHAILNKEKWQAVTLHFISEKIDLGPVIEYAWNPILKDTTAWDLQLMSEKKAIKLVKKYIVSLVNKPKQIKIIPSAEGNFHYYNRRSLDNIKKLSQNISLSKLDLVTRALYFPDSEPAFFVGDKTSKEVWKRYVIYKKGKGPVFLDSMNTIYRQSIDNLS